VLAECGFDKVQGILFDLGVSSMQLDEADRGFSYSQDAPLDMRMDPSTGITAADVLNTYSAGDLARVLRVYGEEKFAPRIAARVVAERKVAPFETSARLVDLVRESIPAAARRTGGNPAKRTFQALRIEVNGELDALRSAIPAALDTLAVGGRIVVMSYQSLEDRIAKRALAVGAHPDVPQGLPVIPASLQPWLRLLTRGAEKASEQEIAENPRAASVRVRAAERLEAAA
jgi:16S rRNA (cytosine1402-N4)-methyltransferase